MKIPPYRLKDNKLLEVHEGEACISNEISTFPSVKVSLKGKEGLVA